MGIAERDNYGMERTTVEVKTRAYRVLGTTNDYTVCELCGRDDLKGTVVLQALDIDGNEQGEPVHYGSDCGARAAKWSLKEIRVAAREADRIAYEAAQGARQEQFDAEFARWSFFVVQASGMDFGQEAFAVIAEATGVANRFIGANEVYEKWLAAGEPAL